MSLISIYANFTIQVLRTKPVLKKSVFSSFIENADLPCKEPAQDLTFQIITYNDIEYFTQQNALTATFEKHDAIREIKIIRKIRKKTFKIF